MVIEMLSARCVVCSAPMKSGIKKWHWRCEGCGLETSDLRPHIDTQTAGGDLDEDERERALRPIRDHNFDRILAWVSEHFSGGVKSDRSLRLLDVGCAHGWFLEKAAGQFEVLGLEPDPIVAARTQACALPVRKGYFPSALAPEEKFDCIVFNDVLEHIPDAKAALQECNRRLLDGGVLVVNAPDRRGVFYQLSRILAFLGHSAPFERMWQVGLPSPHLYYFDTKSMQAMASVTGFQVARVRRLPSIKIKGLYSRIRCTRDVSRLYAMVVATGAVALTPLLIALPSDISVWLLVKK